MNELNLLQPRLQKGMQSIIKQNQVTSIIGYLKNYTLLLFGGRQPL